MATVSLGIYTQSEIPPPLEYTFEDSDGATITEIDDEWTVTFRYEPRGGDAVEGEASADEGVATYVWVDGDFDTPNAIHLGEFHATNGTNTYVSEPILWYVRAAVPLPVGS